MMLRNDSRHRQQLKRMTTITCPHCGESFRPTIKESDEFPLVCEDFGGKCQEILPCELRNLLIEIIPLLNELENN